MTFNPLNTDTTNSIKLLLNHHLTIRQTALILGVSDHSVWKVKNDYRPLKRGKLFQVWGIKQTTIDQLHTIAIGLGEGFGEFMDKELEKVVQSYPESLRK